MAGEAIRKAFNEVPMRAPNRLRVHKLVAGFENRRERTEATIWLHEVMRDPIKGKDKKEMKRELGLVQAQSEGELDEEEERAARGTALPEFKMELEIENPAQRAMPRAFLDGLSEIAFKPSGQAGNHGIIATRWEVHGRHTAELFGVPATGRDVTVAGITVLKFTEFPGEDGTRILRATDDWTYWDLPRLMEQIGATP